MTSLLLPPRGRRVEPVADPYGHPDWRRRRAAYERRHPARCISCGRGREMVEMHLHHLRYDERFPRGDVRRLLVGDEDLVWLCAPEHDRVTALHTRTAMDHAEATAYYLSSSRLERWRLITSATLRARSLRVAASVARWALLTVAVTGVLVVAAGETGLSRGLFGDGLAGDATLVGIIVGWVMIRRARGRMLSRRARRALIRGAVGLLAGWAAWSLWGPVGLG